MSAETTKQENVVDDDQTSTQKGGKHSKWRINRKLLPLKMFYFFFYGASGSFIPFITVYLKHLRLNASEAGLITGSSMLLAMLLRAVVGMIADKLSAKKTALLICCFTFGAAFFGIWFIPRRSLLNELSFNSTSDCSKKNATQHDQQNSNDYWICLGTEGQEMCRYPESLGSNTCKIIVGNDVYSSSFNNQNEKRASDGAFKLLNKTTPCFYVDSINSQSDLLGNDHDYFENPAFSQTEVQSAQNLDRYKSAGRFRREVTQKYMEPYEVRGVTEAKVSCLQNCSRKTVRYFNESSDDIVQESSNDTRRSTSNPYVNVNLDLAFWLSFILLITGKSMYSASTSLIDAVAYTILGPFSLKWGQQRLWGTVGTGLAALSITIANGSNKVESFAGLFIACLGLSALAVLTGLIKLRADSTPKNTTILKDFKKLFSNGSVRLFFCKLLFFGMMAGTAQNFIFWFMVDLGSGQITLGVCVVMYCVTSVTVLRYSRLVLHTLGRIKVMYMTLVAYAVRFLVLSFMTNPWLVLPAEVLNGVTYSLFWAAASSTASIVAPPGTQATSQGLAGAMYWDFGRGVGIVVCGQLLQVFGARWTFRAYSIVCVSLLPLFWLLDRTWSLGTPEVQKQGDSTEQECEAGIQLLKSSTNGFTLNNNLDKNNIADNKFDVEVLISNNGTQHIDTSETQFEMTESSLTETDERTQNRDPGDSRDVYENSSSVEHNLVTMGSIHKSAHMVTC